jgi:predicted RND superfamily exporter protein
VVDTDAVATIGGKVEFVRDFKHVGNTLGGIYAYEVMIGLPEADMAKEPAVLAALDQLEAMIAAYDTTNVISSVNMLLKDINMTMNGNDRAAFALPDSRELVAQYLLLYEMSGGEELNDWVDYEYQTLRLSVQASRYTSTMRERFTAIEQFGRERFPAGTQVSIAGYIPTMLKTSAAVVDGQMLSVLVAIIAITAVMVMALRSVKVGILSMIPNILPVAAITGVMGAFGFALNEFTMLLAPMMLGLAVDDTVHYFIHFREEFGTWKNYRQANRETFRKVGPALIFTSLILSLGFSSLGLSIVEALVRLALLLGVGIITALVADLCITPALFVALKPFGAAEDDAAYQTGVQMAEVRES